MFITYRRVGGSAVLPALAAAGVFVIVGGIAATIAVTALAVVTVGAVGTAVRRAFGPNCFAPPRGVDEDDTIEGVVVRRSPAGSEPDLAQDPAPLRRRSAGP